MRSTSFLPSSLPSLPFTASFAFFSDLRSDDHRQNFSSSFHRIALASNPAGGLDEEAVSQGQTRADLLPPSLFLVSLSHRSLSKELSTQSRLSPNQIHPSPSSIARIHVQNFLQHLPSSDNQHRRPLVSAFPLRSLHGSRSGLLGRCLRRVGRL